MAYHRDPLGIAGTVVDGKYRVDCFVAEGGLSHVYRAIHEVWQCPVALKCFKLVDAPDSDCEALRDAFLQEGRLMAELSASHPGIVQARDVGSLALADGRWIPYLVLEWLEGEPLDAMLRREREQRLPPRSLAETIALLDGAATALAFAHDHGVAHRDLKPENLMVVPGDDGRVMVKILDFGVAKVMQRGAGCAPHETLASVMAFTPHYAAPEQFTRSHGATGPWTDVHAFALIVLEVMRGSGPVLEGDTPFQLASCCCDPNRKPTPRALGMSVSDEVESVFARALSVAPGDRQSSMDQFWSDLIQAADWEDPPQQKPEGQPVVSSRKASRPRLRPARFSVAAVLSIALTATLLWPEGPHPAASAAAPVATQAAARAAHPTASALPARDCPAAMVFETAGKFLMGSEDPEWEGWRPAHPLRLQPFCIDTYEVTVRDYQRCVEAGECRPAHRTTHWFRTGSMSPEQAKKQARVYGELCNAGHEDRLDHPVNCVDWFQAADYCTWRGARLPTEAEWEFAARGAEGRTYPWGEDPPDHRRVNGCGRECTQWQKTVGVLTSSRLFEGDDGYAGTSPVGAFPEGASAQGVQDLIGNVFEWTGDWYAPYALAARRQGPNEAPSDRKVIRGGSFSGWAPLLAAASFRYGLSPGFHVHGVGFRCAATPEN